jgi:DNA repair protein RecO (recombination protein O)
MAAKQRSLKVEGIVLRHREWGESDRMLTLFTRELGKVQALAKGVRKLRSRKLGHVEPFSRSTLLLARGRSFYILTQAEAVNIHTALRENLILLGYASYVVELLDRFTHEEEQQNRFYRLLASTLTRLNRGDDPNLVTRYYEIRTLDFVGFRPQLMTCAQCKVEILPEDQFISGSQGGALCPNCGRATREARPISMQALKYLRHFQRSNYQNASRANIPEDVYAEIENLMYYYLTYVLERGLNSPAFLRRVREM